MHAAVLHPCAAPFRDVLPDAVTRFRDTGAAGVIVATIPELCAIERTFGRTAYRKVTEALQDTTRRFIDDAMAPGDLIAGGEHGTEAIILTWFRPRSDRNFYTVALPSLAEGLAAQLRRQSSRITYPFGTPRGDVFVGHAVALHNPALRDEAQLLSALDEALRDADLNAGLRARDTARGFLAMVLEERVRSVFQPIVDIRTNTVYGQEALVRGAPATVWQSPDEMFASAERTGLVFELDCLCRQSALSHAAGRLPTGQKLFLNCLPSAIHDPNFRADRIRATLESCRLTPADLVFEISEKESIKNFTIFRETRDYYRNLGIQFALDDTGAGYAGLEAVMQLMPDFVKVDISLVRAIESDPGRQGLMTAVQKIAETIGASVIAEGIETVAELEALRGLGIRFGQGFLLGRPATLL